MDKKYLAEIRADYDEFASTGSVDDAFDLAHQIPALLAEVERLTIENLGLKDAAIRCDGYEKRYHAALTELDVKNQQIVTLKRALELMSRVACGETLGTMPEWDMIGCVPDKSSMKENPCKGSDNECHGCWMRYFIQQAAQLTHESNSTHDSTHETHGNEPIARQAQDGKDDSRVEK